MTSVLVLLLLLIFRLKCLGRLELTYETWHSDTSAWNVSQSSGTGFAPHIPTSNLDASPRIILLPSALSMGF